MDEDRLSALLDDVDFRRIDSKMSPFNVFEAVGGHKAELRHSNFLSYLLSPARNHGLGGEVILRLLRLALAKLEPSERPLSSLELVLADLSGATVARESENIDLLIEIPSLALVVVIENKIESSEHSDQLRRYADIINGRFPEHRKLFLFLTPQGAAPSLPSYLPISYAEVALILEGLIVEDGIGERDQEVVVRHYVEMLRRHIVDDDALMALARRVYERHREAFDYILEVVPAPGNTIEVAKGVVDSRSDVVADRGSPNLYRFAPTAWADLQIANSASTSDWTKTGRNLIFEIKGFNKEPYAGRVMISLLSGPAPHEQRVRIYDHAIAHPAIFRGCVKPMGKYWSTIFSRELMSAGKAATLDLDAQGEGVRQACQLFFERDFPMLVSLISDLEVPITA